MIKVVLRRAGLLLILQRNHMFPCQFKVDRRVSKVTKIAIEGIRSV